MNLFRGSPDPAFSSAVTQPPSIARALEHYRTWRQDFEAQIVDAAQPQWDATHFERDRAAFERCVRHALACHLVTPAAHSDLMRAHGELIASAAGIQYEAACGRRDAAEEALRNGAYVILCRRVQRGLLGMQQVEEAAQAAGCN